MKKKVLLHALLVTIFWVTTVPAGAQSRQVPPSAQRVYAGVYLMNLYDLNINEYSFYADFYLWFRWKGEIDPTGIEFVNALEKWGFTIEPFYDTIQVLEDGSNYYGMRIEGRFYHSFALNRFPMDRHPLDIRVENVDYPLDSLVYLPDTTRSLLRSDFILPGWTIQGAEMAAHSNFYETDFGETGRANESFSNFTFQVTIARPLSYFWLKLMLPLFVVILASLGALMIHPNYLDARISLPIGGLLSCVFLQQSYSSALPDVGYMVLMDKIYLVSYVLIAVIMLRVILSGNAMALRSDCDVLRIRRVDRRRAMIYLGVFLTLIVLLVLI